MYRNTQFKAVSGGNCLIPALKLNARRGACQPEGFSPGPYEVLAEELPAI